MDLTKIKIINNSGSPLEYNKELQTLNLYSNIDDDIVLPVEHKAVLDTGIAIKLPKGIVAKVIPNKDLYLNYGIDTFEEVIDSSNINEITIILNNRSIQDIVISKDQLIAKLIFINTMDIELDIIDDIEF